MVYNFCAVCVVAIYYEDLVDLEDWVFNTELLFYKLLFFPKHFNCEIYQKFAEY